ncbi:MAG: hypothetical protein D6755_04435, partial [Anaerolineae bacterium]
MAKSLMSEQMPGNGSRNGLNDLLNLIFGTGWQMAQVRGFIAVSGFLVGWPAIALWRHPIGEYVSLPALLMTWARAFVAPDTLLFVLAMVASGLFALEWAATYISDIFEFDTNAVTREYLLRAAFGFGSGQVLDIRDANVRKEHPDSPLIKIGGPGLVRVHLESAALFEKVDGTPRVLGPSDARQRIEGFERLRAVVDLRDQQESFSVEARTRDGILLRASNVRVLFSVARGEKWNPETWTDSEHLPRRWEFNDEAVEALVYGQKKRPWHRAMVDGKLKPRLRAFISRYSFQELMSSVLPVDGDGRLQFVLRDDLYREFQQEFREFIQKSGIQLTWIGVGTWEADAESLGETHLKFWQDKLAKQKQVRESALTKLRNNTRLDTLLELVRRLLMTAALSGNGNMESGYRVRALLQELRQRLRQAILWHRRQGKKPPEKLLKVYEHLGRSSTTRL